MSKYSKFFIAAAGAIALIGDNFLGGVFLSEDIENSLIALLTAISVYGVKNA